MHAFGRELALGTEENEIMREMMWPYPGMGGTFWGLHWVFGLVTWILVIALLAALIRWIWKKGDKVK